MTPKLRIAIDGNEANISQRVGSNAFAYELLLALEKITRDQHDVLVTVLLAKSKNHDMPAAREGWKYQTVKPSALWTQIALPIHLYFHRDDYDVFYTPGHYGPRVSAVPYVSSVMDLAFLFYPHQFRKRDYLQLKEWTRYSVKHAQKIIAISEHTKKDVMDAYDVLKEKVVVAYPGFQRPAHANFKEKDKEAVFKKWHIRQPFILYVGTLQPRKNVVRLVEAFEKLHQTKREEKNTYISTHKGLAEHMQLVIAGKVGWLAQPILQRIKKSPYREKIIVTGYVTDQEKIILYHQSLCTVLVGLYEGFGIPALEAMAYGSLPVVSDTTSLPEVVGHAALMVNPLESSEIASGIRSALEMPAKQRAKYLKKGREQVKKFNWENSAKIVLKTLKEVAGANVQKSK